MTDPIDYLEHAVDVLARAQEWQAQGQRYALIASVAIKGGTAREIGSLAIVSESGQMVGYLSNGCIDRDILHQGLTVLERGEARLVRYGEGSPFADLSLPCGGSLTILADPAPDHATLMRALADLRARRPAVLRFAQCGVDLSVRYAPKVLLALAGRGAIFRATAQVAHSSGFEVLLLSPEEADLDALAPLSTRRPVHLSTPSDPIALDLDSHSAFVTLFHDHAWERQLLLAALNTPVGFIGCLGSRVTQQTRLMALQDRGVPEQDLARIHGPVGVIGSLRSSSLIAVSTLAEVIGHFPSAQTVTDG